MRLSDLANDLAGLLQGVKHLSGLLQNVELVTVTLSYVLSVEYAHLTCVTHMLKIV